MAAAPRGGLVALFKRGWNEIPDVIGSGIMGLIGIGMLITSVTYYYKIDGDNRRYKDTYTVLRHDDPRVQKVRKDYLGDE